METTKDGKMVNGNCKLANIENSPCQWSIDGNCPVDCGEFTCVCESAGGECPGVCWSPETCLPVGLFNGEESRLE